MIYRLALRWMMLALPRRFLIRSRQTRAACGYNAVGTRLPPMGYATMILLISTVFISSASAHLRLGLALRHAGLIISVRHTPAIRRESIPESLIAAAISLTPCCSIVYIEMQLVAKSTSLIFFHLGLEQVDVSHIYLPIRPYITPPQLLLLPILAIAATTAIK